MEGITIANSAYHSLALDAKYNPEVPTEIKWVKIFTWRANGDGIGPKANGHENTRRNWLTSLGRRFCKN